MGVRVIHDEKEGHAALYCSTTMTAFGPVFGPDGDHDAEDSALAFLNWRTFLGRQDPRKLSGGDLENEWLEWLGAQDRWNYGYGSSGRLVDLTVSE